MFPQRFPGEYKQQQILVSDLVSMKFELLVLVLCFLVSIYGPSFGLILSV